MEIDISKMDKAEVLAKLYNASQPQGMGMIHYTPEDMPVEEARTLLDEHPYKDMLNFDYLKGRVMKVHLAGDAFDPRLYDRDNGDGAAARALGV